MIDLKELLPFWLNGTEAQKAADAFRAFFQRWEDWLAEIGVQADLDNCSDEALELWGWERSIERLPEEPDALYRDRVRHAMETHRGGGVRTGLDAALAFYGITGVTVIERDTLYGEDTIRIQLDTLPFDSLLLGKVLEKHGRACRRYTVGNVHEADLHLGAAGVSLARGFSTATDTGGPIEIPSTPAPIYLGAAGVSHLHSLSIAS